MAITTTYICDMCKAESNTSEQFWSFSLFMHSLHLSQSPHTNCVKTFDACRDCAELFGVLPYDRIPEPEEPPSIENLLREVMSRLKDE